MEHVMSQWLIFLIVIPLVVNYFTKNIQSSKRFMWLGVAFGLVVAPVSFGLIQMAYIPVIGKALGLAGVIGNLTHGTVGYMCLIGSGFLKLNATITATQLIMVNLVNGVLFSYIYGLVGYAVDKKVAEEKRLPIPIIV